MKVLHVIPSVARTSGGPVRSLLGWVDATASACSVTVAATREGLSSREERRFRSALGASDLRLFDAIGQHTRNVSPSMLRWLCGHVGAFDVVHIHALLHPISSFAALAARRAGTAYILRPLGTLSPHTIGEGRAWLKRAYVALVDGPNLARAGAVHFTTDFEQRLAEQVHRIARPVVIPVPCRVSARTPSPDDARDEATVLYLSRLDPKKGLECLIDALALLRRRSFHARLIIAGAGDPRYVGSLHDRVHAHGLGGAVEFTGFVDGERKRALFERATVFALPSMNENFSNATVEAMAHGLVPVVSGEVGIASVIAARRAGIVTPRTPPAVCAALHELIAHPARRAAMGARARSLVEAHYDPRAVGARLEALYRSLAPPGE